MPDGVADEVDGDGEMAEGPTGMLLCREGARQDGDEGAWGSLPVTSLGNAETTSRLSGECTGKVVSW